MGGACTRLDIHQASTGSKPQTLCPVFLRACGPTRSMPGRPDARQGQSYAPHRPQSMRQASAHMLYNTRIEAQ